MLVADVFKVYLYADSSSYSMTYGEGEDITAGILNVSIVEGTDLYEGPQEQIDTGQFTIVTRNPNLDPKINPNLKYNSGIRFVDERSGEFFRGYVTDVQVQYQRKDDPIITITGTDIFGAAQRVIVSQDTHDAIMALSTGPTWNGITFSEMIPYMNDFTSKYLDLDALVGSGPPPDGFWFDASQSYGEQSVGLLGYSPGKYIPKVGESYLEVMNKYAQTNLTSFTARGEFGYYYINVFPFVKYDPNYWVPQQDPTLQYTTYDFSSDPADAKPYQSILLDNGYNRVINQTDIFNEYRYVDTGELKSQSESFTRISSDSIEEYAISRASISTIYPEDATINIPDWADTYSENIFQVTQYPGQEIQQITFDNARLEDIENDFSYSDYNLNRIIRIKHQIDNDETIDRVYDIAGISHNISPDNWEMTFTLKPNKQEIAFQYQGSLPILTMNEISGDANFNFTATIGSVSPEDVSSITWALSATDPNEIPYIWPYALNGNMFENGVARTGFTQTWNFDDDGILAPYSFDEESTYSDPTDNRYGGYGPGFWNVYAFIELSNGFTIVLQQELTVGTPEVEADFGWVQNLTNNFGQVSFVDTSVNNETGEVDSYAWDFGDGETSALQNPVHVYDPAPDETEYEVSLTVFAYGPGETKVYDTYTETITLVQPEMVPDFTSVANYQTVTFTNTSTNVGFEEPDAYLWEFDDGTTSTLKNPVHTFPVTDVNVSESFDVTLTTRNIWEQTESVTKTVTTTALNESGTLPVSTLRLRFDPVSIDSGLGSASPLYFYMFDLKARTSNTLQNLSYLRPTTRINSSFITWYEADGTTAESGDPLNLTRDSSITPTSQYGLSPFRTNTGSATLDFKLDTTIPTESSQLINDILLTFRDVGTTNNIVFPVKPRNKLFVDVPDSFGGWVNIGYYQILNSKVDTAPPAGVVTQAVKTMTPLRPLPMNIPYFKYTFNNTIASFTSMETGVSYAWDFGDGTTSTLKDPVKTFPDRGTYTVSLTVTFADSSTRTTTEPVIVEYLAPYPVRYFKLVQNLHTGTHEFDTPYIDSFNFKQDYVEPSSGNGLTFAKTDVYASEYRVGTTGEFVINPLTSPNNNRLTGSGGLRVKSLDGTYRTEWEMIADFGSAQSNLTNCSVRLGRWTATGFPETLATGINYSIFITDFTGTQANIGTASWTKLGDFTPTSIPLNNSATYNIILT